MGTLELDMVLDQFKGMTRYAAYYSGPAELGLKHIDKKATMEPFVKGHPSTTRRNTSEDQGHRRVGFSSSSVSAWRVTQFSRP